MKQPVRFTIQIFLRNTRKRPKLTRILLTLMFQIVLKSHDRVFWPKTPKKPSLAICLYMPWERPYQNLWVFSTSSVQLCCEWICTQIRPMEEKRCMLNFSFLAVLCGEERDPKKWQNRPNWTYGHFGHFGQGYWWAVILILIVEGYLWTYRFEHVYRHKITHLRSCVMFKIVLRPLVWVYWSIRVKK